VEVPMRASFLLLPLTLTAACGGYEPIRSDDLTQLRNELTQLRRQAEPGGNVGRFQLHQMGTRTWRFDTATGEICLLLTSDTEWKDKKLNLNRLLKYGYSAAGVSPKRRRVHS